MSDKYVNKLVIDGVTRFDLTNDTVTPETLISGTTAHDSSGAAVVGTADYSIRGAAAGEDISFSGAAYAQIQSLVICGRTEGGASVGDGGTLTVTCSDGSETRSCVFTTGLPLRGIKVSDGGSYTDENGQQWLADEIVFPGGLAVTRIADDGTTVLDVPMITMLSEEENAGFRRLRSFGGSNTVTASDSPYMEVGFLCSNGNGHAAADLQSGLQSQIDVINSRTAGMITVSSLLTLTAAGWDSTTLRQTVTFAHDTSRRNVIDITIGENAAWDAAGVYAVSETAAGITFECSEIPETALTFRVTSMEVS
ncbi:MAG: hypothetical protein IK990_07535 [Ruminiclostridium sp.]|nr:hypothetical protein [Ruminiclostridium sp.]